MNADQNSLSGTEAPRGQTNVFSGTSAQRFRRHLPLLLLLLIAAGAFWFRSWRLDLRPLHTDEAVHAAKLGTLLETGTYLYDPREYHGPTIYYAALPLVRLTGARTYADIPSAVPLRLSIAFFGAGLVLLPLLLADALGRRGAVMAGALTAVSPAFVFYSRYFIQEVPMVFFTWAAIACAWRYICHPRLSWALLAGASVGLMQATKETSVIAYACALSAGGLAVVLAHGLEHQHREPQVRIRLWHIGAAVAFALLVAVLALTNFFRNPVAALDMFRTYATYLGRAGTGDGHGTGAGAHVHPWYYYLQMLLFSRNAPRPWWSEGLILLLALPGTLAAFRPRLLPEANRHFLRFLALVTLLMTIVYSVLSYKTPWNMLGFFYGMILLAGAGTTVLLRLAPGRWGKALLALALAAGLYHLAAQSWRGNFRFYADPRNPYVYGHTSTNFLRMVERIEDLAAVHPEGRRMTIRVFAQGDDYWPLPWYLRRFPNVGFWNEIPRTLDGPVVVTTPGLAGQTEDALQGEYLQEFYGLRPEVLMTVFIRDSLWETFLKTRQGAN